MKNHFRFLLPSLALVLLQPVLAQVDQRTENVVHGVNFIGLSVSDLEQSLKFYSDSARLEKVQTGTIEGNGIFDEIAGRDHVIARTALLKSSNAQLRLMEFTKHSDEAKSSLPVEVHGPGLAHVCFQVASSTQTYRRFLEAGASPIGWPEMVQLNPRNPVVYAYARDPDGAVLEVEHIDFDKVTTPRSNDYRIRHISLASPNIERMVEFYSLLMQEPAPRRLGQGGTLAGENFDKVSGYEGTRMEMAWFQVRNLELEIVQYHSHPTTIDGVPRPLDALGLNMIVFDVSDIDAAREVFVAAGGRLVTNVGELDDGEVFFGRDPDGNLLGFQSLAKNSKISSQNFSDNGV
ncbi:MAG: VOC family protein [Pseudohongiellaceae bacterium]